MGFLMRFASFIALVAAIVAGTVDSIRSISESTPVLTPLGAAVASFSVSAFEAVEALERPDGSLAAFAPVARWLLAQPAFAMFLMVALVLWMIGYRRPSANRFA